MTEIEKTNLTKLEEIVGEAYKAFTDQLYFHGLKELDCKHNQDNIYKIIHLMAEYYDKKLYYELKLIELKYEKKETNT